MRVVALLLLVAACAGKPTKHDADYLAYDWDDRRVLCSDAIDDLDKPVNWTFIDDQLKAAHEGGWVLMLHAHTPGVTVSMDSLEHALSTADKYDLASVTFRDMDAGATPRGGLALAFDDNAPDQWMTVRDVLAAHHAHATFFVSRWQDMTPEQHQELAVLHQDGNDLEPHTVNHLHARDYVAQYGMDAYIQNEVLPSFDVLTAAGFAPAHAFAYPFGEHDAAIDERVLEYVDLVRTTPGECPW
jgi:peptidoglycan/xylan/chitin deacetylase (PgdA/CDA1 family)